MIETNWSGTWRKLIKNEDIPSQRDSLDCGVFMLMYALYITFEWPYDFNQTDMPYTRECWLNLVLKCMSHKRCHKLERFLDTLQGRVLQNVHTAKLYAVWRHLQKCIPGYVGRGRRGELVKFISEDTHPDFCSEFCQICAHHI
ncbi:hypothetical protein QQF64_012960 [Cirrhinus molitorella]|uniref:Ubiquitin-like protease family profile domain-containing protein n=1 Tax=Cirrhinus molitorella TaxID=172907 RepID=A0ABR3LPS1_9TELE